MSAPKPRAPPSQLSVPQGPFEIDWSHPLANGLLAIYIPGSWRGLAPQPAVWPRLVANQGGVLSPTPFGSGLAARTASSGATAALPAAAASQIGSAGSIYWRGLGAGVSSTNNPTVFGIAFATTDTAPYFSFALINDNTSGFYQLSLATASGAFASYSIISAPTTGAYVSLGGTFKAAGNIVGYGNGNLVFTKAINFTGNLVFGSAPQLGLGSYSPLPSRIPNVVSEMAALWSRDLSSAEMAWLNNDPYAMLRQVRSRRKPYQLAAGLRPTLFVNH